MDAHSDPSHLHQIVIVFDLAAHQTLLCHKKKTAILDVEANSNSWCRGQRQEAEEAEEAEEEEWWVWFIVCVVISILWYNSHDVF